MRHSINDKKQPSALVQQERRCNVCGRFSKECRYEADGLGHTLYCVCPRCLVEHGDADEVKLARLSIQRK